MIPNPQDPHNRKVVLATGTAVYDAGLLDVLLPLFQEESGYTVDVLPVGSGRALDLGKQGKADALFVHAAEAEEKFMAAGYGADRALVMYSEYIVVGPAADPAGIGSFRDVAQALRRVAQSQALWLSRGDQSGTHLRERVLWARAGVRPEGPWYQKTRQGMAATLRLASERRAYTLAVRGTFLKWARHLALRVHLAGDPRLDDEHHIIVVNPEMHPQVNFEGACALAEFFTSPQVQDIIRAYGVDEVGEPLFGIGR